MPPVEKTVTPARAHNEIDAATVVAPSTPLATAIGMSRAETFLTPSLFRNLSSSSGSSPTDGTPFTTAVIAGNAFWERTAAIIRSAASRLDGYGSPCASTELSRATTGRPSARALVTSGRTRRKRRTGASGKAVGVPTTPYELLSVCERLDSAFTSGDSGHRLRRENQMVGSRAQVADRPAGREGQALVLRSEQRGRILVHHPFRYHDPPVGPIADLRLHRIAHPEIAEVPKVPIAVS